MPYVSTAEFNALGLPAAALSGFTGDPDDFAAAASGTVDSYLRGRYKLPLSEPYPQEIKRATAVLMAYDLLSVRGFDAENGSDQNTLIRYEKTIEWLNMVAAGKVNLSVAADATPNVADGGPSVRSRTRDSAERFRDSTTNAYRG